MSDAARETPWFRFFASDWLAGETTRLMSLAGRGLYIDLLCHAWGRGSVPADPAQVARLVGAPVRTVRRVWDEVRPQFETDPDDADRLICPSLEEERSRVEARRDSLSRAGRRGAQKRWHSDSQVNGQAIAEPSGGHGKRSRGREKEVDAALAPSGTRPSARADDEQKDGARDEQSEESLSECWGQVKAELGEKLGGSR